MSKYYLHKITKDDRQFFKEFDLNLAKGQAAYCLIEKDGTPYHINVKSKTYMPYYISPIQLDKENKNITSLAQDLEACGYFEVYCEKFDLKYKSFDVLDILNHKLTKQELYNFDDITDIIKMNDVRNIDYDALYTKCNSLLKAIKNNDKYISKIADTYQAEGNWQNIVNLITDSPETIYDNNMEEDYDEEYDEEEEYDEYE